MTTLKMDLLRPTAPECPVCGTITARATFHQPFAYWRCPQCRTAHLHPQPSPEFLEQFYEQFHRSAEDGGLFAGFEDRTSADFPAKARLVFHHVHKLTHCLSRPPRVLDVGCGKGYFVRELTSLGAEAEGIDISRVGIEEGMRQGIKGLHAGRIEDRTEWSGLYDAVTAWATIEHLPDPQKFLLSLRRLLKPGGLLFLDTGLAGDFVDDWAPGLIQWYDPPQHLFVFSRTGMEKLLRDAGYALEKFDAHFERSRTRRCMKFVRNCLLVLMGAGIFRLGLGKSGYARMRMEAKMPFGSLMFLVARPGGSA